MAMRRDLPEVFTLLLSFMLLLVVLVKETSEIGGLCVCLA